MEFLLLHVLLSLLLLPHAPHTRDLCLEMVTSTPSDDTTAVDEGIHMLPQRTVPYPCVSWRLVVETNNLRGWYIIPAECQGYISDYMLGDQFWQDCAVVAGEAIAYAEGLKLAGDGMEAWVFNINDTSLTNIPYYADTSFRSKMHNTMLFDKYVANANAGAIQEIAVVGHQGRLPHWQARMP